MTGDDIGLGFYTSGPPQPVARPSAFAPVDQAQMIDKLDDVADDDLGSTFFGDSITDVENASVRAFDIGIRVHADVTPAAPMTTAGIDETPAVAADPSEVPGIPADLRSAFILGGPSGIRHEDERGG